MDNKVVAQELIKVAKDLIAVDYQVPIQFNIEDFMEPIDGSPMTAEQYKVGGNAIGNVSVNAKLGSAMAKALRRVEKDLKKWGLRLK